MVIVVEIEDRCEEKPFLGGWKNIVTGTEYHDAHTQTFSGEHVGHEAKVDHGSGGGVSRTASVITQTQDKGGSVETSMVVSASCCKYTSVPSERATQTSRLPDLRDKLVTPLAVTIPRTATPRSQDHQVSPVQPLKIREPGLPEYHRTTEDVPKCFSSLEEESALRIQKYYRAYKARLDIEALAKLSRETRAQTPPKLEKVQGPRHPTTEFEIVNAAPPSNRSDFEMLENVLGRWRVYENERIDRSYFGNSKFAARTTVLLKEIELLRSIDAIKTRVRAERRERRYLEQLDKLAEPEVWNVADGKSIFVDTIRVQRARECRDFYRSLLLQDFTTSSRTETLINLKEYTRGHTCRPAQDVISLIDQELELISHDVEPKALESLRNRLKVALLRLALSFCDPGRKIEDQQPHQSCAKKIKTSSKLCNRCGKFLPFGDLVPGVSRNSFVTCENCKTMQVGRDPRIVYEPYELMLRDLRSREAGFGAPARSPAFVVDPRVIYRLVNYVWHGKSGISECDDLFRLMVVRFRAEREWSPWNTLVLTRREAALHQAMPDPWQIYAPTLMKKFVVKNLQAKLRFDFLTKANFC